MSAVVECADVAGVIKVRSGDRTRDGACSRKEACHGDLRKRMRPLYGEFRTKVAQGSRRQVQSAAKIAGVTEPHLVHQIGSGCPDIAQVQILLPPFELLDGPRDVAVWLSARRVQRRDGVVSFRVEV